jgi:hypothetical protein
MSALPFMNLDDSIPAGRNCRFGDSGEFDQAANGGRGRAAVTALAIFLLAMLVARGAEGQTQPQIAFVPAWETLFIGDSITGNWTDEPIHIGFYGEQACAIRLHFAAALAQNPQVKRVVIEAGTTDIIAGPGPGVACFWPLQDPVSSVVDMVTTAKQAGLEVFVLSVLPISWNNQAGQPCDPLVPPLNASLKTAVTAAGAIWVDDYDAFVGHPEYQVDGVHPNEEGYQVIEGIYIATANPGECKQGVCPKRPTVP